MTPTHVPAHKRARHVKSTAGRIPPKRVTAAYLNRLIDEACKRYRGVMESDLVGLHDRIDRYTQTRTLLDNEIARYRSQCMEDGR